MSQLRKHLDHSLPPSPIILETELEDDLLDLLSDSDNEGGASPGRKEKPKIQLMRRRSSELSSPVAQTSSEVPRQQLRPQDSKPITSIGDGTRGGVGGEEDKEGGVPGFEDLDRPTTSRGRIGTTAAETTTGGGEGGGGEGGGRGEGDRGAPDILRLDSLLSPSPLPAMTRPRARQKDSNSASNVDFGDDDGDILSGMGLDDSDLRPPTTTAASREGDKHPGRRPSKLDDLLGLRTSSKSGGGKENELRAPRALGGAEAGRKEEEEGGYQFGGYSPSAAGGSTGGSAVKRKGLPAGRRRSAQFDSLTDRPSSAPSQPAKKSVRFADTVEVSDRPSTSPAVSGGGSSSLHPQRERDRGGGGEGGDGRGGGGEEGGGRGGGGSKRRISTDAGKEEVKNARKPPVPQQQQQQQQHHHQEEEQQQQQQVIESEIPLSGDETAPRPASQSRRRSSSLQKSSAAALFEESGDGGGSGGGEEADPRAEPGGEGGRDSAGEQRLPGEIKTDKVPPPPVEKLEHPVFPWQQTKPRSGGGTPVPERQRVREPKAPARIEEEEDKGGGGEAARKGAAEMASLQKQLLQQQKETEDKISQLQPVESQETGGRNRRRRRSSEEGEGEFGRESTALQERVKELERSLEKEKKERDCQQVCSMYRQQNLIKTTPSLPPSLPPSLRSS